MRLSSSRPSLFRTLLPLRCSHRVSARLPAVLAVAASLLATPALAQGATDAFAVVFYAAVGACVLAVLLVLGALITIMNVAKRQRAIPIALGILVGLATMGGGGWLSVQLVRAEWWFLDIPEKSEFNANFQMAWVGLALFLLVVGFGELAIAMRAMKPAPAPRRPASPS